MIKYVFLFLTFLFVGCTIEVYEPEYEECGYVKTGHECLNSSCTLKEDIVEYQCWTVY